MVKLDELTVDTKVVKTVTVDERLVRSFGKLVEDFAPAHFDKDFAISQGFSGPIAHGFLVSSLVSGLLGQELPGIESVINEAKLKFHLPVLVGERVVCSVVVQKTVPAVKAVVLGVSINREDDGALCVGGSIICSYPKA